MPFTFAHPAAILPVTRLPFRYSLSALVIGSMMPDFEYFLRMRVASNYSHTLAGILLFDIPVGIVVWLLFHFLVKKDLLANMPAFIRHRFNSVHAGQLNLTVRGIIVLLYSLLVGTMTHIVWDAFTHRTGYFVQHIPFLNQEVLASGLPAYKLLQHLSTIAGLMAIIFVVIKLPIVKDKKIVAAGYWPSVIAITVLVCIGRILVGDLSVTDYGSIIVTIIAACMLGVIVTSIVTRLNFNSSFLLSK